MKAVWFRFKESGHVGMAVAQDVRSLFWIIDEFGNPFDVEIANVGRGAFCVKPDIDPEGGIEWSEFEGSESLGTVTALKPEGKRRWRDPEWPRSVYGVKPREEE